MDRNDEKDVYKDPNKKKPSVYIWTVLAISFLLFFLFLPVWPYAFAWGYYPAVGFGFIFLILLLFVVLGGFSDSHREPRY